MRLPRRGGFRGIRRAIRQRSITYTFTRKTTENTGRFGESADTSTSTVDNDVWLFEPDELPMDTEYGDRVGGDLNGLAIPEDVDVQRHDEVDHGIDTYEVLRVMNLPDNDNKQVTLFSLERKTNN